MKTKTIQACLIILFLFLITIPSTGASREETIDKTSQIDGTLPVDFEFLDNDWQIKTDDGDVEIYFTKEFSADFHIHTDDGHINSQLPIIFKKITSKRDLSGKIKDGGYLISIRTDDGDITLKKDSRGQGF